MTTTKARPRDFDADVRQAQAGIDAADERLVALRDHLRALPARIRVAIVERDDVEEALRLQAELDQGPLRIKAAEVAVLKAKAAEIQIELDRWRPEYEARAAVADAERASYDKLRADPNVPRLEREVARLRFEDVMVKARAAHGTVRDLENRIAARRREIAAVFSEPHAAAPVVRSIPHARVAS